MRAVTSAASGHVHVVDRDVPEPGRGQLQVRVSAATINPVDLESAASGRTGRILGWEAAGVVSRVGAEVDRFTYGDHVLGWTYWFSSGTGTQAEYTVLDQSAAAIAPAHVEETAAAALPLNGGTAFQALVLLDLKPGDSLAVLGAAGQVGGFAVDLARHRGVEVVGVASAQDEDFVTASGATYVPRGENDIAAVREIYPAGVDAIIATAPVEEDWYQALTQDGRFLSTVGQTVPFTTSLFLNARPDGEGLSQLVRLVDGGHLRLRTAGAFALDRAAEAYAASTTSGVRGRVVLLP